MMLSAAAIVATSLVAQEGPWRVGPTLPGPVSNNAVVSVDTRDGPAVFSFLGLRAGKRWDDVGSDAYRWTVGAGTWSTVRPVPGPGRLAGTAQSVKGRIYLFGGYTVAEDGSEESAPQVDVYDADQDTWSQAAPMPVPVDDAISGVWRDSLVVLVSGWHDTGNVTNVQIFDPATDVWRQANPIPGPPVFGHAGGVADDVIVYLGGAKVTDAQPRFQIEPSAWRGDIDPDAPSEIAWSRLPAPPSPGLYRAAGGSLDGMVLFVGGTDNPYNYSGVGYDGVPAEPRTGVFAYDVRGYRWVTLPPLSRATMDHRSVVVAGEHLVVVGGMVDGQVVSDHVALAPIASSTRGR